MALNVFGTPSNMTYSGSGASGDPYVIESTNHSVNTTGEIIFQTTESGTIFPNLTVDSEIASDVAGLFRNTIPIWQASGQDNFSTSFRVSASDQVKVNYIKDGAGAFGDDNVTGSVYFVPDPPEPLPEVAIVMVTQPVSSLSGSVLATQPSVKIVDVNGDIVPGTLISVTVGAVVVSGAAVASGTLTVEPVSGNVVFTDLVITGYGSYYLSFTAAGLTPASSNTITFVQDPGNPNPPIPVKPKRSYIASSVPNSGDMETNEFAINVTDKKGYVRDSNGIIHQVFDGNASGTGSVTSVGLSSTNSTLTISDSPVTTSGTIKIDLPETGVSAKSYTNADITIDVYGRITSASDGAAGVTSIIAGTGVSVDTATGDVTVTNSLPDQTVTLTDGTGILVTGTYPDFTITNDAPDQTVTLTDGTGISVTGTYPDFTIATTITQYTDSDARLSLSAGTGISYDNTTGIITNDAPDQTVSITSGTGINVTGTYPDFTIDSTITQYTDSDARLSLSAGTGISYDNATGIITNSEPDQIVSLTGGTDISVTGTYPDFTIDFDGNTSYLPLSGGTMTGSITSFGTTHDTEVSGDFFGVQLSADHTQGTMVNFDGLDTYDGASHMKVTPTGLTFPDATTQTTAYTGGAGVSSIIAGTGISVDAATGDVTVTNSAPDQTVSLTAGTSISITGTYPDFTIGYSGTNLSEAENLIAEVYNNSGATLTKGIIVYINGGHGNLPTVAKALATSDATSAQTFGIVRANITDNNNGYLIIVGNLIDLDTSAYVEGTQLYLSGTTAGTWTSTKPSAPTHLVYVGIVVRSHPTQGVVTVKIQNGYELDEIHDVSITSVANSNIIQYNSTSKLWVNVAGTTKNISEDTNLYYTDTRARSSVSSTATGLTYTSGTGVFSLTSGYSIPTTAKQGNWDTAYTSRISSLTVTGSSGAATLVSNVLNIPTYTLSGLGGIGLTNLSSTATGITYTNTTGVFSTTSGYGIPTTSSQTNWDTAYTNRITSLTTTGSGAATLVSNVLNIPTPSAATFTSLTVTGSSGASTLLSGVLNVPTYTLSGLGGIKLTDLSSSATGLTYTNTTGAFSLTSGYSIPTTAKQGNWDTAYSSYLQWDGGSTSLVAATGRTSLGATTVGSNLFTLINPSSVTFPRFNLDNTVSALDAATFRGAIGAGTSSTSGTVTSVAALTLGTTGTDVSSTVATGTTTPVITLNIPTASATNRGAVSSSDWSNFNTAYTNRITSLTTTGSSGAATLTTNTLNVPNYTLAGLGGIKLADLSSTATGLTYTNTTGVFSATSGYAIPTTASQTNWDSAYTQRLQWDGGSTNLVAATGRTSLGATTVGANLFTLTNPSAVTFPRFNLDNTVSSLDASTFRTAIGAGTSSTTGTVTSVAITVPTGLSVTGTPITSSGTLAVTLTAGYSIPTTSSQTTWDTAYTNRITSLTTTGSSGSATLTTNTLNIPTYTLSGLGGQASSTNLTSVAGLTYVSASFVKMTAANTFSLDTSTYLTANQTITLSGDVSGSGTTAITTTLATVPITKGGTGQTTANAAINALLPSQTSNSGKYLTTDGSNSSWGTVSTGTTIPSASMQMFAGAITQSASAGVVTTTAPTGWLLCNGDAVSRTTYATLFAALGSTATPYGYDATTFNLPDLRSRVPLGVGTGSGLTARTLGGTVGTETETLTSSQIPAHSHPNTVSGGSTGNAGSHSHTLNKEVLTYLGTGGDRYDPYPGSVWKGSTGAGLTLSTQADHSHTFTPSITNVNNTGGGGSHNNMQPSIGFNFIIKT